MRSPLMEYLGIAWIDIAWLFLALFFLLIMMIVLFIVIIIKYNKLKKGYDNFMSGKNAKSLEEDIAALFEDNKFIKDEYESNRKLLKEISKIQENCFQKMGLVKYDAFNQMGGSLSFSLCILNDKNDGYIVNSVHSSEGCYVYTKEIRNGLCDLSLGEEEEKALKMAMKSIK